MGRFKGTRYSMVAYYVGMIRPTNQDTTVIKVIAVILTDPKRKGHHMRGGAHGEELGW